MATHTEVQASQSAVEFSGRAVHFWRLRHWSSLSWFCVFLCNYTDKEVSRGDEAALNNGHSRTSG